MPKPSFWSELKRRNVTRVAIAYLFFAWLVLQISDVLFPVLMLPDWSIRLVAVLLAIGLVLALIFSWAYELTAEGLKRESQVEPSASITADTGRRLNLLTIALVVLGIGVVLAERWLSDRDKVVQPTAVVEPLAEKSILSEAVEEAAIPFVAVLPFKAAGTEDSGFLASGLHDDLLTRLAKLDAFRVISRTSVMEYADSTKNIREIGKELGVGYILEGGVQAQGKRVRINVQLIDANADKHLWAETYDRDLTAVDLFDIQSELAVAIAAQLEVTLSDSARELINEIPTRSTEAYTAYIRGLELRERPFSADTQAQVVAAFEEAVSLDPQFAQAWARLSQARLRSASYTTDATARQASRDAALAALERAKALQPDSFETRLALAESMVEDYKPSLQALEVLGNHADTNAEALELKAELYAGMGRKADAYETLLKAQRLAPRSISIALSLIDAAMYNNDCEAAGLHAETARALAPDNDDVNTGRANYELSCTADYSRANELLRGVDVQPMGRHFIARLAAQAARDYNRLLELAQTPISGPWSVLTGWRLLVEYDALRQLGRNDEAATALDRAGEFLAVAERGGVIRGEPYYALTQAMYHALRGDAEGARHWIEVDRRQWEQHRADGDAGFESEAYFFRARIFAIAGLNGEAIGELKSLFEERDGYYPFQFVDVLPWFDGLRDDPGYLELGRRYGQYR